MLYIENLCQFVRLMIENEETGTFWPQNGEYSNTSRLVAMIAAAHGKKIWLTKLFNWALPLARCVSSLVDKAFGNLAYDRSLSAYKEVYQLVSLEESILRTEKE